MVIGSALNRKLVRDLWTMRAQALAIALVVAAGVAMYVMYLSTFASLRTTLQAYYASRHFGDVFATLTRAPRSLGSRLAALPDVSAFELRVVAEVTLDLPDLEEPATGHLVSLPRGRRPRVNDVFLRRGRLPAPGRADEVLASENFAAANRLAPGDRITALLNGRARALTIVGLALSPEFVYAIRPGELVPDDRRFAILWMGEDALASAFDLEGAFNDVVLTLAPGTAPQATITAVDRLLAPYGGRGALPRRLQMSNWMLESELNQLQTFGFFLPLVFLLVAAFILNIALARALALQRPSLAALKALGYGNLAIGWHYLKWALVIAGLGIVLGTVAGRLLGAMLVRLYNDFFRFPVLAFTVPPRVLFEAAGLTLCAAAAGAFGAVRRAVRIPPAEAMRPEAPARYRQSVIEIPVVTRHLGSTGRMIVRTLARHPFRAGASVFGMGFAVAILMIGFVFNDIMDELIRTQFWDAERQDVTLTFAHPRGAEVRHALLRLPGVRGVELTRAVAARISSGHRERHVAITGVPSIPRFKRIIDRDGTPVRVPPQGLVLSLALARLLDVEPGQTVSVDVLEGTRPRATVPVAGVVDDTMGLSAYIGVEALHRLLREGAVATGALLLTDSGAETELAARVKAVPEVAGAAFKRTVLTSFRDTMAANMTVTFTINLAFAGIIAFGVVYNAARISLSERSRELASLRVLGFTRAEISFILLGELAALTLLALPIGLLFGYSLTALLMRTVESEVYRFPMHVSMQAAASAGLGLIIATLASGLLVRRRLDRLDLVAVLKVRD